MIAVEVTAWSRLVTCSECPSWRHLTGTRAGAWRVAAEHLSRTHGDVHAATNAREAAAAAERRAFAARRTPADSDRRGIPRHD